MKKEVAVLLLVMVLSAKLCIGQAIPDHKKLPHADSLSNKDFEAIAPYLVEAAVFAFKSLLSKGAMLADEVGVGKTIMAGIRLSQKWAEHKRRLLIICPANLREQRIQELADNQFGHKEIVIRLTTITSTQTKLRSIQNALDLR